MAETRELSRVLASGRSANARRGAVVARAAIIDRSIEAPAGFQTRTRERARSLGADGEAE